jgi:hypothetical protein
MGLKWLRSNCNWKLVAGDQNSGSRHAGEVLASCLWAICTGFFSSFSTWGRNCWYSNAISFGAPRAQFNGSWEVKCFGCHWHLGHPSKASNHCVSVGLPEPSSMEVGKSNALIAMAPWTSKLRHQTVLFESCCRSRLWLL